MLCMNFNFVIFALNRSKSLQRLLPHMCLSFIVLSTLVICLCTLNYGHSWGGDFSAYIMQAKSINQFSTKEFINKSYEYVYKKLLIVTGKGLRSKIFNNPYRSEKMNVLKYSCSHIIIEIVCPFILSFLLASYTHSTHLQIHSPTQIFCFTMVVLRTMSLINFYIGSRLDR